MINLYDRALKRILCGAVLALATIVVAGCGNVYGHAEFDKLVMNKSDAEVEKTLGKPAAVDSSNPARVVWTYNQLTYDIDNHNQRDSKALVVLAPDAGSKLKVVETKYEK